MPNIETDILNGDGKTIRRVKGRIISLPLLPDFAFIIYRESGQAYWVVSELTSGKRLSLPRRTQAEAIASASERVAFVGVENTKKLVRESAAHFAALKTGVR